MLPTSQDSAEGENGQNQSQNTEPSTPDAVMPVPVILEPDSNSSAQNLLQPLFEYAQAIVQAIMMTTEPVDTRNIGYELLKLLEEAHVHNAVYARRWARSSGRTALVKYEKALTSMITGLPRDDPQLWELRDQRRQALDYLK
jgi:hypothetical protein